MTGEFMLKKLVVAVLISACTVTALTGCGNNKAAGTAELATQYVTATPTSSTIDSDVVSSTGTFAPDDVSYTLNSTLYNTPNTGSSSTITASDLVVSRVTLTLNPANTDTPALPLLYQTQYLGGGQRIPAGGSAIVPVRLVSQTLKKFLFDGPFTTNPNAFLTYRATVSFEVLEVNTNRVSTITAPGFVQVNIADFPG
jgi:hypothetical protein